MPLFDDGAELFSDRRSAVSRTRSGELYRIWSERKILRLKAKG
jgi:hypothetical protein